MGIRIKKLILVLLGGLARGVANNREKTDMIKILGVALLAGLLVFNTSAFGGTTIRRIDGYQEAKWGMSPEEVKKLFPKLKYAPPSLEKVPFFSSQYPGELLTEDLVLTFSFSNTILRKLVYFDFYFCRYQLYKVRLSFSRPLDYKYFKWFWEAIERKYESTEEHREFPATLSPNSWFWKDTEENRIHLFWEDTEKFYVISYVNTSMSEKLDGELKKLEEEKAKKRRQELEDIF